MSAPVKGVVARIKERVQMRRQALVAAAKLVRLSQIRAIPSTRDWQTAGWDFYDTIGEYRQSVMWRANYVSRVLLYAGRVNPLGDGAPDAVDPGDRANIPLAQMFNGPVGQQEALHRITIHLTVPGETYVVATDIAGMDKRLWLVCSNEELVRSQRSVKVRPPDSEDLIPIDVENSMIMRIWEKHGKRAWEADSATKSALGVLGEISDIQARTRAELQSRLRGAGVLEIAEGATLPEPPEPEDGDEPLHDNPDMAVLIDAMVTPIHDRDSASAVVPIVIRVPGETAGKGVKFHDLAVKIDERLSGMLETALKRLGAMLDVSPERVTTGLGDTNHWSSTLITEDETNAYISPIAGMICNAFTEAYYRPALAELGVPNPDEYQIWFNAAPITQRPNKSKEAAELNAAGKLSDSVARREAGFSEEDAMTPEERLRWLLEQLALKGIDPNTVAPYLRALGVPIAEQPMVPGVIPSGSPGGSGAPALPAGPAVPALPGGRPSIPDPIPPGGPPQARSRPHSPLAADRWFMTAIEVCVLRALEVAGNRLCSRTPRPNRPAATTPPWLLHTLVPLRADNDMARITEGAFSLLRYILADDDTARGTVEEYVRQLLATRQPHRTQWLADALTRAGIPNV